MQKGRRDDADEVEAEVKTTANDRTARDNNRAMILLMKYFSVGYQKGRLLESTAKLQVETVVFV